MTFVKSQVIPGSLRVDLSTSDDPAGIQISQLLPSKASESWWSYQDDETLRIAIDELVDLVLQIGIPWLTRCGGALVRPPEDLGRALLDRAGHLYLDFRREHSLSPTDSEALASLESIVLGRSEDHEQVDWGFLLGVGAFLGEVIVQTMGGKWDWDEPRKTACVAGLGGKGSLKVQPLLWAANFWVKPDPRFSFVQGYALYRKLAR